MVVARSSFEIGPIARNIRERIPVATLPSAYDDDPPTIAFNNPSARQAQMPTHLPPLAPLRSRPPLSTNGRVRLSAALTGTKELLDLPGSYDGCLGQPVSVRPLRLPHARLYFCAEQPVGGAIDYSFARRSGLLPNMVPRRLPASVVLTGLDKSPLRIHGQVEVAFDAFGCEFSMALWVADFAAPFEMLLGREWLREYRGQVMCDVYGQDEDDACMAVPVVDEGTMDS